MKYENELIDFLQLLSDDTYKEYPYLKVTATRLLKSINLHTENEKVCSCLPVKNIVFINKIPKCLDCGLRIDKPYRMKY